MNALPSDKHSHVEQIGHLRHELLTRINHILGLTEIQMDEALETECDYVPALTEINACGRTLFAIIESELNSSATPDLLALNRQIESEARPTLGQAQELVNHLNVSGRDAAAQEMSLVLTALESLLSISQEMIPQ